MAYKFSPPDKQIYKSLQEDARAFYAEAQIRRKEGGADYLLELDPPDPVQDAEAVKYYEQQLIAGIRGSGKAAEHNAELMSPRRRAEIHEWARKRANVQRYIAKAAGSNPILTLKDFFVDTGVTALFPAYVETRIQQGRLQTSLVSELVFADETASSPRATALYFSDTAADRTLLKTNEGAELPATEFSVADSTITLYKYGRQLQFSYESLDSQNIDAVGNMLTRIGQQIGINETDMLLNIAIAGDGTTAGAAETDSTDTDVASAGTIAFSDLLNWFYATGNPAYQLDKAVAGATDLKLIADLAEFADVEYITGQGSLPIPTPVGIRYFWWDGGVSGSSYVDRLVIGFDSSAAMMRYTYGGFIEEADRLITRQVHRHTFSYYVGFRKFDATAVQVLDVNAVL